MDVYHFYVSITWMSMNIWVASSFSFTEYACKSLKRKKNTTDYTVEVQNMISESWF